MTLQKPLSITLPETEIRAFCERHKIRKMALFGSVLRDDSDVDILVEFAPSAVVGREIVSLEHELSDLLKRKADLNTTGFLSPHFRDEVLQNAQVIFST